MSKWQENGVSTWKHKATVVQQNYCDFLGDRHWDVIEKNDWISLRKKVAFALYGDPTELPSSLNRQLGYDKKCLEDIEKVCAKLVLNISFLSRSIYFGVVFIAGRKLNEDKRFQQPVFRAQAIGYPNSTRYVDSLGCVYDSWDKYLKEGCLPKCFLCYPLGGCFNFSTDNKSDEVLLEYDFSPSCFADYTRRANANWEEQVGRGSWYRGSLDNLKWYMMDAIRAAAVAGEAMGKAGRIALLILQTDRMTYNGLRIADSIVKLVEKNEKGELTPLDVFQFTASVLFFTNSAINYESALTIITEMQENIIARYREDMRKDADEIYNQTIVLQGRDKTINFGNTIVARQFTKIENSKQLYELMVGGNVTSKRLPDGVVIVETSVNHQKIMEKAAPLQTTKITKILEEKNNEVIDMALKFARMAPKPNTSGKYGDLFLDEACEFARRLQYFVEFHKEAYKNMERQFHDKLAEAIKKPGFNLPTFLSEYGIEGDQTEWFRKQALKDLNDKGPAAFESLEEAYVNFYQL